MTVARAVWVYSLEGMDSIDVPDALAAALGLGWLDEDFVEQFNVDMLSDYGLSTYLTDANGMDADQVAADAAMLDALSGPLVLVFSSALQPGETPAPRPPLRLIGHYTETITLRLPEPLAAATAKGTLDGPPARKTPSDAAMMGRVAMVALLVIFALTGVVIWVAS